MTPDLTHEVIFIGLPGPTHHYAGLSTDNVASGLNRGTISNPKQAALQAIALARKLSSLGIRTGIIPPLLRPYMPLLRAHMQGDDDTVIQKAPLALLEQASSSSAMWVANAATVSPVADSADHALHITTANLHTNLHRRIEAADTHRLLRHIFAHVPNVTLHTPLDATKGLRDEGAANHMRLAPHAGAKGLHVFVYGADDEATAPKSARHNLAASKAIANQHHLPPEQIIFVRQNPAVIRQGVFHNDVIAVSNDNFLLVHEHAYEHGIADIARIEAAYKHLHPNDALRVTTITEQELDIEEAVHTYFFNSQIVSIGNGDMAVIAPSELDALYDGKAGKLMHKISEATTNPIKKIHMLDLRQSMRNGGGPACLRLRIPMTDTQIASLTTHTNLLATESMLNELETLIMEYYPEKLAPHNLHRPALYHQCRSLLTAMGKLMKLPLLNEA